MRHVTHNAEDSVSHWRQWLLAALAAGTLIFGYCGQWQFEKDDIARKAAASKSAGAPSAVGHVRSPDPVNVLYQTFQLLLVAGGRLDGPVPWALNVGRLCGVATLFMAALQAFVGFFREEMVLLRIHLPWRRQHVIICGAGWRGVPMAKSFFDAEDDVVIIEKDPSVPGLRQCRQHGIATIVGDATDPTLLRSLRVQDAKMVVAMCSEDGVNMEIAIEARRLAENHRSLSEPLRCYVHMSNIDLRTASRQQAILLNGEKCVFQTGGIDLYEEGARWLFSNYPLDFEPEASTGGKRVHLVVAGFNQASEGVILHVARIGHFAGGKRLRITVIDPKAGVAESEFRLRYPQIDKVCEIDFRTIDFWDTSTLALAASFCSEGASSSASDGGFAVTFVVCLEDDSANLSFAFKLDKNLETAAPVRMRMSSHSGLGVLLSDGDHQKRFGQRLSAFGMLEDVCNAKTLEREELDAVARTFHESYCAAAKAKASAAGKAVSTPGDVSWASLAEDLKNSNRYAADHLWTKLRAAGYRTMDAKAGPPLPDEIFTPEQIETLAQMEHSRYCADRHLAGWTCAKEKNNIAKTNPTLVEWDQLPEAEKEKDREQVRQIRGILAQTGKTVSRLD